MIAHRPSSTVPAYGSAMSSPSTPGMWHHRHLPSITEDEVRPWTEAGALPRRMSEVYPVGRGQHDRWPLHYARSTPVLQSDAGL